MSERILITGVAGFIGSNLADRLLSEGNYKIIGIDNLSAGILEQIPSDVEFHQLDIRRTDMYPLFKDIDYVFHLAAKNSIIDCQINPVETADVNVTGTINVFEAARLNGVKKIIYAESSAMYEGSPYLPSNEKDIYPQSFYALSKFASMYFAEAYARFYNLNSTALRYFCVYGPRQDYRRTIPPVFSSFIIKLLKRERPIIYGNGNKRRDFVYIDDINDFHLQCIKDERTTGKSFNLGSGINYSINEIYRIITSLLNVKIMPEYKDDQPGEALENLADISEASKLGWEPKTSLESGLKISINYIKSELSQGRIK
jgi:nucleoside-diphosphate-sugar epimerase